MWGSFFKSRLIWATERRIEPETGHGPFVSQDIPAWFFRRGSVRLGSGVEMIEAREGQWLFPMPGTPWAEFSDGAIVLSVRFQLRWPSGEDVYARARSLVVNGQDHPRLLETAEALRSLHEREYASYLRSMGHGEVGPHDLIAFYERGGPTTPTGSPADWLNAHTAIHAWLEAYVRMLESLGWEGAPPNRISRRMSELKTWMETAGLLRRLSRAEIARKARLSEVHLAREFNRAFGTTPRCLLERHRFFHACLALTSRERSIKEIAGGLGYTSPHAFSNWFSRLAGRSPRDYRRELRV